MTNADKIRAMSNEELAETISRNAIYLNACEKRYCALYAKNGECPVKSVKIEDCAEAMLNYLNQEI
ncbi:MAG: hypothetical protein RSA23_09640 [Carnobacterium sp.]